jgi:signal transduction histidine kinase
MHWPRSLFGRVAGILLLGLVAAHALTFWWILRERSQLSEAMMLAYVGRDVASSLAILERLPPGEREAFLPRLARHNYHYALGASGAGRPVDPGTADAVRPILSAVTAEVGAGRVQGLFAAPGGSGAPELRLRLSLADATPVDLVLLPPRWMPSWSTMAVLCVQLAALLVVTWLAVRIATRPLSELAGAAHHLGSDLRGPALPEHGPIEVARASRAFNAMRGRVVAALDERLRMLAAIAHDLRTPLTRMGLRTELLPDAEVRERLQADIGEMRALVESGLDYARTAHAGVEAERPVDLHALLDSLVCDYEDAGRKVRWGGEREAPLRTRPQALRRVLINLVDNALQFGGEAEIALESGPQQVTIAVRDRGPGIAPEALERVLEPFVRLDGSRSRDTGGAGLGLAIAHELMQALGGRLRLRNLERGGLEAALVLPATADPAASMPG